MSRSLERPRTMPAVRVRARSRGISYRTQLGLMLAPFLLGLIALEIVPVLAGLPLAFTSYNALQPPVFVGLDNFRELARDEIFHKAIFNSIFYAVLAVPVRLIGALALALLLLRPMRGGGAYRAAVYVPTVVPDIVWALLWLWLLNPIYGPINQLLAVAGIPGPAWMIKEYGARFAIVLMTVWQLGEAFVACLAALGDIPRETLDQSSVDGATGWQTLTRVTLPLLTPVLLVLLFRDTILSLQINFVPALILGGGGGPNYATTFLPMYSYSLAFEYLRFGYAAAATWITYLLTALVLLVQYRVAVRWRVGFRNVD